MYPSFFVGNVISSQFCKTILAALILGLASSAIALTGNAGWIKVPNSGETFDVFYDPLSIQPEGDQVMRMLTLINYTDSLGKDSSLVSETLYNCTLQSKQDQYTFMFSGHWASGEPVNSSSVEQGWRTVLKNSVGMNVLKIAC